jgi:hypothetical protein
MNAKEELTKLLMESYDQGVKDGLETSLQLIKERLAQPEQEPSQQKKVWTFWDLSGGDITDAIKAKLKEKNT